MAAAVALLPREGVEMSRSTQVADANVRRRIYVAACAAALALLLAPGVARAQGTAATPSKDVGWWVGGGGGYLAGRAACSNCETEPDYGNGGSFVFQGGVRAWDRLHVGGELYSTTRKL